MKAKHNQQKFFGGDFTTAGAPLFEQPLPLKRTESFSVTLTPSSKVAFRRTRSEREKDTVTLTPTPAGVAEFKTAIGAPKLPPGYHAITPQNCHTPNIYWIAVKGITLAAFPDVPSCLASVEDDFRNEYQAGNREIYVITQPQEHGDAAWKRWSKKWSERTKKGTA